MTDFPRGGGITRRHLLKTAAAGVAATAFDIPAAIRRPNMAPRRSPRVQSASTPVVQQHFVSRPDLAPQALTVVTTPYSPQSTDGLILLAPYSGPPDWGPMIVDSGGNLVWFRPAAARRKAANLRLQVYRGQPVLTWWEGVETPLGYGLGEYVLADRNYREVARVKAAHGLRGDHHAFRLTPQGTAMFIAFRETHTDLRSVGGPHHGGILESVLQEVDVRTGRLVLEWHSLLHVPISESYRSYYGPFWDYMHANSIDLDVDGHILLSARNMHTIYKLDRRTGRIIWRLGGKHSDFELTRGTRFAWQHDFALVSKGRYTVFNNASNGVTRTAPHSSAMMLAVNERRRLVTLLHTYTHDPPLLCDTQGSVQVLPSGSIFVGWGSEPYFSQYTVHGTPELEGALGPKVDSYRAYRTPWTGLPGNPPAIALQRSPSGGTLVYMSWNGATEVAAWRILAGPSEKSLTPVTTAAHQGFETTVALQLTSGYIAAQALDSSGSVLRQSSVIRAA